MSKNESAAATAEKKTASIEWNDANMRSTYANVCNVTGTREEVTVLFGLNQTWNPNQGEISIDLTDRIILNPHAARRLSVLLNNVLKQHDSAFSAGSGADVKAAPDADVDAAEQSH
jgi:hypothetical protein